MPSVSSCSATPTFLLRHFLMLSSVSKSGDGAGNGLFQVNVYDSLSPVKASLGLRAIIKIWEEMTEPLCLRRVSVGSLAF